MNLWICLPAPPRTELVVARDGALRIVIDEGKLLSRNGTGL